MEEKLVFNSSKLNLIKYLIFEMYLTIYILLLKFEVWEILSILYINKTIIFGLTNYNYYDHNI